MEVEAKEKIKAFLEEKGVRGFALDNLRGSYKAIGFSEEFTADLASCIENDLDFESLRKKHHDEIATVYSGFWTKRAPLLYRKYVIPYLENSEKIMDVGCGPGVLARELSRTGTADKIIAVDIHEYPEWGDIIDPNIDFRQIDSKDFSSLFDSTKPDKAVFTWSLHHMDLGTQEGYLVGSYEGSGDGFRLVMLEDAYSANLRPEAGEHLGQFFSKLESIQKKAVMSVCDWVANELNAREHENFPFSFRTLEGFESVCRRIGYKTLAKRYIGFPENRDVNTPQSLLVVEK